MIPTIDVGKDFYHRLANRDNKQGDGKYTAVEFRKKYLADLNNEGAWKTNDLFIEFDFSNVKRIGPSFANEAFGYFTQYARPEVILQRIKFKHISEVQLMIIKEELEVGYYNRK
jgi:hypothetical protein